MLVLHIRCITMCRALSEAANSFATLLQTPPHLLKFATSHSWSHKHDAASLYPRNSSTTAARTSAKGTSTKVPKRHW